jgi:hypothetical protein
MEHKRSKLALVLMTLMLLLALAAGPAVPGLAARIPESVDGLHGLLAQPYDGGGSGA